MADTEQTVANGTAAEAPTTTPTTTATTMSKTREDGSPKLFIGQIPRAWTEADLMKLMEEFGPVFELVIMKDRVCASIIWRFVVAACVFC